MQEQKFPDRIRYHYQQEPDARLRPTHGVWGGVNPHGEIECCFYDESDIPPAYSDQLLDGGGSSGQEQTVLQDNARHITRNIHTRLIMNYETAKAVLEWLEDRLDELESEGASDIYNLDAGIQQ